MLSPEEREATYLHYCQWCLSLGIKPAKFDEYEYVVTHFAHNKFN